MHKSSTSPWQLRFAWPGILINIVFFPETPRRICLIFTFQQCLSIWYHGKIEKHVIYLIDCIKTSCSYIPPVQSQENSCRSQTFPPSAGRGLNSKRRIEWLALRGNESQHGQHRYSYSTTVSISAVPIAHGCCLFALATGRYHTVFVSARQVPPPHDQPPRQLITFSTGIVILPLSQSQLLLFLFVARLVDIILC